MKSAEYKVKNNKITEPNKKLDILKGILSDIGSAVVAFSGGVDSTFLLKIAFDVLKEKAVAAIGRSCSFPDNELKKAIDTANEIGAEYVVIETGELNDNNYLSNTPDRCYYCKKEIMSGLIGFAKERDYNFVIEGSNTDDTGDFRPGKRALDEMGIRSPLIEADFSKQEIREISRELGLPTWDKPSMPCLSSRIPYGTEITAQILKMIESAEEYLFDLGLRQVRVRYHGDLARIEVPGEDMHFILREDIAQGIATRFTAIGFKYISLDIQGYRMGSLNEGL